MVKDINMVKDILPWISIPEPKFIITLSPSKPTLKPGEHRIVETRINSNINLNSSAVLTTNDRFGIHTSFAPQKIGIPPNGIGTSELSVQALENTLPQNATMIINGLLSFQSAHIAYENAANARSYLTIIVLDYPFSEKFKDFWDAYGDAISLIGGGFIGGFSGFMFARLEKKKK